MPTWVWVGVELEAMAAETVVFSFIRDQMQRLPKLRNWRNDTRVWERHETQAGEQTWTSESRTKRERGGAGVGRTGAGGVDAAEFGSKQLNQLDRLTKAAPAAPFFTARRRCCSAQSRTQALVRYWDKWDVAAASNWFKRSNWICVDCDGLPRALQRRTLQ